MGKSKDLMGHLTKTYYSITASGKEQIVKQVNWSLQSNMGELQLKMRIEFSLKGIRLGNPPDQGPHQPGFWRPVSGWVLYKGAPDII